MRINPCETLAGYAVKSSLVSAFTGLVLRHLSKNAPSLRPASNIAFTATLLPPLCWVLARPTKPQFPAYTFAPSSLKGCKNQESPISFNEFREVPCVFLVTWEPKPGMKWVFDLREAVGLGVMAAKGENSLYNMPVSSQLTGILTECNGALKKRWLAAQGPKKIKAWVSVDKFNADGCWTAIKELEKGDLRDLILHTPVRCAEFEASAVMNGAILADQDDIAAQQHLFSFLIALNDRLCKNPLGLSQTT